LRIDGDIETDTYIQMQIHSGKGAQINRRVVGSWKFRMG
jgi:hypothetical protein